jgi:hypothetical protein
MEIAMRTRRVERIALTTFFLAACTTFFGAGVAIEYAHAQGLQEATSRHIAGIPAQRLAQAMPETPVSPTTPGTLPGTGAGSGSSSGTNPVTGQPCNGGGSTAVTGSPGATGEINPPDTNPTGSSSGSSVYGTNSGTGLGAC